MRYYKPIEIAKELDISTSALRHYESWGVIPIPARAANGYRLYTQLHLSYFRCLRAMFPGFGVAMTCEVLRHLQAANLDAAFWLVNKEQANLQQEKMNADQTLELLQHLHLPSDANHKLKPEMTIGEVAQFTGIRTSSIRHWEKEGLLIPIRNSENGYRMFTPMHVRKILLIRTLRSTVYYLERVKEIIDAVEHHSIDQARKVTEEAIRRIHERNRQQLRGIHQLMELCMVLELL
ncbi:TioE family transcriptional regulator [Paenibacillus sp. UMB4589-SE434]|uniref:TioE family transcriptional regulator n=1 Tax=Paenibacillus sp. UMB4589-SE434 TaxID=3046314 RepID=UPI0025509A6A|nr:TioE family transcriptional regulator [Paenibacillus sp. UMB4589-SE434]MDK8179854.1 TioE family transcriptional regulator [Paenibacillus sp. UMB4589-SE434]